MPRLRKAPTLQSMCYPVIVEILWDWWLNSRDDQTCQVENVLQLYSMPPRFTKKMLDILAEKHTVFTGHFLYLLHCGLDVFTLTRMYFVQFDVVLNSFGRHDLQKLVYLDASKSRLPFDILSQVPATIPNIQVLKLQFTTCNDDILTSISTQCPILSELDISYCSVTDTGIFNLTSTRSTCKESLTMLNVTDTKVSIDGAVHILNHLPNLMKLDCHDTLEILLAAHENYPNHVYNLTTFQFGSELRTNRTYAKNQTMVSHSCNIAVDALPYLSEIKIKDWNPHQPESLKAFSNYQCLSTLEFDVQFCPFLSMADILPILNGRGYQLRTLILKQIQEVNIMLLIDSCFSLKVLHMQNNTYFPFDDDDLQSPKLNSMQELSLIGSVPQSVLVSLISRCPSLESLSIHHGFYFTIDVLQEILVLNPLVLLRDVWFLECDMLTDEALQLLISYPNKLQEMCVEYCRVSLKQHNKLMKWMEKNYPTVDIDLQVQSRIW